MSQLLRLRNEDGATHFTLRVRKQVAVLLYHLIHCREEKQKHQATAYGKTWTLQIQQKKQTLLLLKRGRSSGGSRSSSSLIQHNRGMQDGSHQESHKFQVSSKFSFLNIGSMNWRDILYENVKRTTQHWKSGWLRTLTNIFSTHLWPTRTCETNPKDPCNIPCVCARFKDWRGGEKIKNNYA